MLLLSLLAVPSLLLDLMLDLMLSLLLSLLMGLLMGSLQSMMLSLLHCRHLLLHRRYLRLACLLRLHLSLHQVAVDTRGVIRVNRTWCTPNWVG